MTPHFIDLSLQNSSYSAQLKTWHVTETWSDYPEIREQWNLILRPFSKFKTLTNTGVKDKRTLAYDGAPTALCPSSYEDASWISWPATVQLVEPDWAQRGTCPPTSTSHDNRQQHEEQSATLTNPFPLKQLIFLRNDTTEAISRAILTSNLTIGD